MTKPNWCSQAAWNDARVVVSKQKNMRMSGSDETVMNPVARAIMDAKEEEIAAIEVFVTSLANDYLTVSRNPVLVALDILDFVKSKRYQ